MRLYILIVRTSSNINEADRGEAAMVTSPHVYYNRPVCDAVLITACILRKRQTFFAIDS